MSVGRLVARGVIGGIFVGHGLQKLTGAFGGPGIEGFSQATASMSLRPARRNAYAAALSETLGGGALVLGLFTPAAAAALIGTMVTAIRKVHLSNGPWNTNGGWEYNGVLIGAVAALAETGPGSISLDHAFGIERRGPKWALGALALGAAASTAAIELGKRAPAEA